MNEVEPASEEMITKTKTGIAPTITDTEMEKEPQETLLATETLTMEETTRSPLERTAHDQVSQGVATHSSSIELPTENKETPHQETYPKHVAQDRCVIMDSLSTKKQEQSESSKTSSMSHIDQTDKYRGKIEDMKEI